jgi:hypothetical protein
LGRVYYEGGLDEGQCTVITAQHGVLRRKRIARGREKGCGMAQAESNLPAKVRSA